ncbi:MAG: imidazole glycerol phosphate synthase subunit HisH [Thermoflavifilum sp.]|nr:imidazole glycerol phosphate synthase subunit HisH [Thermoflavifilum sp.]MCL6514335.1 imidazole glycerol phosphate synthase subunit HisH [Alicyclobacillus sp.]
MIAILDPGIGNLRSVQSALRRVGGESVVVQDAEAWARLTVDGGDVDGVILPGVGAFGDAMFQLKRSGLLGVVRQAVRDGLPLLGICLGMQLLFAISEEHGQHVGLGFLPGRIVRFTGTMKIPHMGWNDLVHVAAHPLLEGVRRGDFVYFVHSYYARPEQPEHVLAAAEYGGVLVPAVVGHNQVMGTQFHPEKSGEVGERILANFVKLCAVAKDGEVAGGGVPKP